MDAVWPRKRTLETQFLRRFLGTVGAAFAVGIGYMDPGNWATDLDATRFGNSLLWSIVFSGVAAAMLQILVVRFAAACGTGLMEAIAVRFRPAQNVLWTIYALSIVATEIAEFVGLVVGLQMVLGLRLPIAIALGVAIFAALLLTGGATARRFEVIAIATTAGLAIVYAFEIAIIRPTLGPVLTGALIPSVPTSGALLAVVGIVGATIMPHNLFLHGGLVRDAIQEVAPQRRPALIRNATLATIGTLAVATLINAAISIVGSATHANTIESAFRTLRPVAGPAAALLFGLALIAAALAASASGACAGDIICVPDAPLRLTRLRRRVLAVGPAVVLLALGLSPMSLLIASQVALGIALPAVVIPLLILVLEEQTMKTRADIVLIFSSGVILVATCACDGLALSSLIPHL